MAIFNDLIVNGTTVITGRMNGKLADLMYPVGAIYISINSENPTYYFGGTWERVSEGTLLIGAGSLDASHSYTAGTVYGSYNMAAHTHSINMTSDSTTPTVSSVAAFTLNATSPTVSSSGTDTGNKDPGLDAVDPGLSWNLGDELPDHLIYCDGQGDTDAAGIYIGWNGGNRRYKHSGDNKDHWGHMYWNFNHGHTYNHTHGVNNHQHSLDHSHTMTHTHNFSHNHTSTHAHSIAAGTTGAPSGDVGKGQNIMPYTLVYIWKRTA